MARERPCKNGHAGHTAFERHAATEEAGETALLSALSAAGRRTLADLLRKLVLAAEDRGHRSP